MYFIVYLSIVTKTTKHYGLRYGDTYNTQHSVCVLFEMCLKHGEKNLYERCLSMGC